MNNTLRRRLFGPALLCLVGGCALPELFHLGGAAQGPAGPAGPTGSVNAAGPPPGPGNGWRPPAPNPLNGPAEPNEQASLVLQQLKAAQDDKGVLVARMKMMENQLRDKDRALIQASVEIRETSSQIARSREELQRWKQEMETLRGKLASSERDNKASLEAVIHTLEQFLDREKESARRAAPLGPEPK